MVANKKKNAWLIGLYNNEIEARIERLGFNLTHFYSDMNKDFSGEQKPSMIVFSGDRFTDLESMLKTEKLFPDVLLINLPANIEQAKAELIDTPFEDEYRPINRLLSFIKEREHRWDN